MTDRSPSLNMPYLQPSQAQKHVTHNEAIELLDAVVQLSVLEMDATLPPSAPEPGDRYLLGAGATGAWAGQATGTVARWDDPAWLFLPPQEGWQAWGQAEGEFRVFQGGSWTVPPVSQLGINSSSDSVNRLTVASQATLMTHEGNGHQLKINKAGETDTASLLFQSNWIGHAEMGLAGNTDWSLKVSADGSNWVEALKIDHATGLATGEAVQSSRTDATTGRMMTVGAFGLGAGQVPELADLELEIASGLYGFMGSASGSPVTDTESWSVIVSRTANSAGHVFLATRVSGAVSAKETWIGHRMASTGAIDWQRMVADDGGGEISVSGINFGQDSLNHYEEGTFTPVISDAQSGGNNSSTVCSGKYTRVGRLVTVEIEATNINTFGLIPANALFITGLPFALATSNYAAGANGSVFINRITYSEPPIIYAKGGDSFARLAIASSGANASFVTVDSLQSLWSDIYTSFTYHV